MRRWLTVWLGHAWSQRLFNGLWALGVLSLPITSLPLLVQWSGAATVAPVSVVWMLLLALFWLLPALYLGRLLPRETGLIGLFAAWVVISWAFSFFRDQPTFRDFTILAEGRDVFITLGMGLITYLTVSAWISSETRRLKTTLQLVNWSGGILLGWCLIQAFYVFFNASEYPDWMFRVQEWFSARRELFFPNRLTGLAYEPSWLAHQLVVVYLPLWISSTLKRFSVHRWRIGPLTLENLLLIMGVWVLFGSFSRVGWLSFLLVLGFLMVRGNLRLADRLSHRWQRRLPFVSRRRLSAMMLVGFSLFYLLMLAGLLRAGARFDFRLARLFDPKTYATGNIYRITNELLFAERIIYWAAGWELFNDYPWLGVGLGNAGFFFQDRIPAFGWALTEIQELFLRQNFMPNIKSFWVRLLAETGLVGFSIFMVWYYLLFQTSRWSEKRQPVLIQVVGLAGQLALVSFLIEGFSIDSLALPYLWFSLGLLSANGALARQSYIEAESFVSSQ